MKVIFIILALFLSGNLFCQESVDTLRYSTTRGDLKFYKKNVELKFLEMSKMVREDPAANQYMKKAKFYRNLNGVFLGVGIISLSYGVLFGLATAIEEKDATNAYSGLIAGTLVGGAFIGLSIPPGKAYKQNARKAIDLYNKGVLAPQTSQVSFNLEITRHGLTLAIRF